MKGSPRMDALRAMRERDYAKGQKLVARKKEHARKMLEHLAKQATAQSDAAAKRRKAKRRSNTPR
jgi:hypothetical protein